MSTSVTARIRVTVEIVVGVWNESETFVNLAKTAKSEGIQIIKNKLSSSGVRIIDEPTFIGSRFEEQTP